MEYKFSVIIPVYNAEKTISRCLDSLLRQEHECAEIILINDGSTDRSGEICKEYARCHACIVYFEKQNGGASSARNAGLSIASGKYITFVDSDDYVEDAYFQELSKPETDFVVFGQKIYRYSEVSEYTFGEDLLNAETNMELVLAVLRNRLAGPCNKRFSRSIIDDYGLRFREDLIIGEDFIFGLEYMLAAQTSCVLPLCLYCIDETGNDSVTRGAKYDFSQFLLIYQYAFHIVAECQWEEIYKDRLNQVIDYLYCRTSFACIERCITRRGYTDITPRKLVRLFRNQLQSGIRPINIVHRVMRQCVQYEIMIVYCAISFGYSLHRKIR